MNCVALPASLIESELFGHERGAFTGAVSRKIGRFELADGGSIFLNEIGDLPFELQSKLLRVLQENEFERVGGSQTIKVNVRVIAATNRNLETAVDQGHFRPDLFYRLNVFPIRLPPLREKREDIPLLANHFIVKYSKKLGKQIDKISKNSLKWMMAYGWPGNTRELENVIERAIVSATGTIIDLENHTTTPATGEFESVGSGTLAQVERNHIQHVLTNCNWVIEGGKGAAVRLGLHTNTLRSRMKRLGIERPS